MTSLDLGRNQIKGDPNALDGCHQRSLFLDGAMKEGGFKKLLSSVNAKQNLLDLSFNGQETHEKLVCK